MGRADILPRDQNRNVMMMWIVLVFWVQASLPPINSQWVRVVSGYGSKDLNATWSGEPSHASSSLYNSPTEILQRIGRNVRHVEIRMRFLLLENYDSHDCHLDGVTNGGIPVQGRNHIHNRQQILLKIGVLVELCHGMVRHDQCFHMSRSTDGSLDALLGPGCRTMSGTDGRCRWKVTTFTSTLYDHLIREAFGNFLLALWIA